MRALRNLVLPVVLLLLLSNGAARAEEPGCSPNPVVFEQRHPFSRAEARERVQQLLDYWASRWGVHRDWQGDTARIHGRVMGILFDAELVVGDHRVSATASDPGFFFRDAAFGYVSRKLRKYLHPSYQEG